MMTVNNPYSDLAPSAYWKTGVTESNPARLEGLYKKKFSLQTTDKVAAAGSCFAQKISQHLKLHGYQVADYEPRPGNITAAQASDYGYDLYSARFGNIYTVQQLLQLAREAAGLLQPQDTIWQADGRFYDALRPNIQPGGFESEQVLLNARNQHIACVRNMFLSMDVFIFTLGLTECWRHKTNKTIYPVAPGVIAGEYDETQHEFVNFEFGECKSAFEEFIQVVTQMRQQTKPDFKLILTVSPVPLTATATGDHVLRATTYSKSVLRAMAEELRQKYPFIDYFPSYEIITNQMAKGTYYQSNGRSINDTGVDAVMHVFFSEHANNKSQLKPAAVSPQADDQCDEVLLDAFAPDVGKKSSAISPILFFGNSHLASVKNCIAGSVDESPLFDRSWYLAYNWLDMSWLNLPAHDYLRAPILKDDFANLYHPLPDATTRSDTTLVITGLTIMGDGILRAFGDLQSGNKTITDGRKISPKLPILIDESSNHVKKRFEIYYNKTFHTLASLISAGMYQDIYIIESPDMIESVARFRLGDKFVESGSYPRYKSIARTVVSEFADCLNIKLISHPDEFLGEYGFSADHFANTEQSYDIHVSADYFTPALQTLQEFLNQGMVSGRLLENQTNPLSAANSKTHPALRKLGGIASTLANSIGGKIRGF